MHWIKVEPRYVQAQGPPLSTEVSFVRIDPGDCKLPQDNQRVSSLVFQRSPIIIVVGWKANLSIRGVGLRAARVGLIKGSWGKIRRHLGAKKIDPWVASCENYIFINILLRKNFCFRSGDNADEILPPSNLHGSQLTQTGSSSVNRHQQDRKDSSKLIAIMNSMKKSEKKKFQLLLQQFTNSNDRLVSQWNQMYYFLVSTIIIFLGLLVACSRLLRNRAWEQLLTKKL